MKKCQICGKSEGQLIESTKFKKTLCKSCYDMCRLSKQHEIPPYGEIRYDDEGKPICHICGFSFRKLMTHVWQKHNMTAYEYKKEFGLETSNSIMSEDAVKVARERVLEHPQLIHKNLIERGINTRYKKGSKGRTADKVSALTRAKLRKNLFPPKSKKVP